MQVITQNNRREASFARHLSPPQKLTDDASLQGPIQLENALL
jgi:hypothetical protein